MMGSTPRWLRSPVLAGGVAILGTTIWVPTGPGRQVRDRTTHGSTRAPELRAVAYAGRVRAELAAPSTNPRHMVVRLWRDGHPLVQRNVFLASTRLFHSLPAPRRAQGSGNTYSATLPLVTPGWWEVQVHLSSSDHRLRIPFLLQVASRSAVFPLCSPPGAEHASVSLVFGREIADVHVDSGAVGAARIQVTFRPAKGHVPANLRVSTSMLDMAMGTNARVARKTGTREYVAHVFVSMPGLWRVDLGDGPDHGSVALLLGRSGALAS